MSLYSIEGMDLGRKGELKFLVISCHLGTGTEEEQVMMAARNCLYLPALSSIIEQAMELPVTQLCQEVMGATLSSTEQQLRQMRMAPHTAPDTSRSLPLCKQ